MSEATKSGWSQHDEDEIIGALLQRLGIGTGFFVEFGAWDGKHLSNTYLLYQAGWSGCYIEGSASRMKALEKNCPEERIIKVNAFVQPEGESSLDRILKARNVRHVDVLSIDIDSDDYAIWQSVEEYLPAILIIEYNPEIPFDTRYVNPRGQQHGNSALSLAELSARKGYLLAAGTETNLIFVKKDLAEQAKITPTTLQAIQDKFVLNRCFFAYDGSLIKHPSSFRREGIDEVILVPWTNSVVPQPYPKFFRKFRDPGTPFFVARQVYGALRSLFRAPLQTARALSLRAKQNAAKVAAGKGK